MLIKVSCYFVTGINVKVDLFYSMLFYLMGTFAPKVRVKSGDDKSGVRNWLDDRVELAIRERNDSYDVWSRVRGDRLRVDYIAKRRHADALVERKYSEFVSVNLDPGLPPKKLHDNLRRLGVINGPERFNGGVDVERLSSFFLRDRLLPTADSNGCCPVKFSDYRPISLLACLSKVFEVLMARQMEAHIRRSELLTVFQFGFRRHHSTTAAVLKVTAHGGHSIEYGRWTSNGVGL
jgi:hypothetical protein